MMTKILTYSELITIPTFDERYEYLKIGGKVGIDTFGFDRYLNQKFYNSTEWKRIRDSVIARDLGRDLGVAGREINGKLYVHHMNPIEPKDLIDFNPAVLDPNFLITVSFDTHNAIHYGDKELLHRQDIVERKPNDTCPWKTFRNGAVNNG